MQADNQRWTLFGLDLAPWMQYWRAGWRELFWGQSAGIRRRLEAPVALRQHGQESPRYFVAEEPMATLPDATDTVFAALLLPAERVLLRRLQLPASLEADLDEAILLEVQASSPFPADDTCHGWCLNGRSQDKLDITLAIVAVSGVIDYLQQQGVNTSQGIPEVWCLTDDDRPIVLHGFGEGRRASDYRRRLGWLGAIAAGILVLALLLLAVPGLVRHMQADNMEYHFGRAQQDAAHAMQLREQLGIDNDRALALQEMVDAQTNYHDLLDRLTVQTEDGVYFEQLTMEGDQIRIRGWATNAAGFMQTLSDDALYAEVSAPGGIRRHGRTGLEQFTLELRLAPGASAE